MEQKESFLEGLLLTETVRTKAKLKYELRTLENTLDQIIKTKKLPLSCPNKLANLCHLLSNKYLDYLRLMDVSISPSFFMTLEIDKRTPWLEHYQLLLQLKKQLTVATLEEEKEILIDIASLYFYIEHASIEEPPQQKVPSRAKHDSIYELFRSGDIKLWFIGLINFWSLYSSENSEPCINFQEWTIQQQQYALDFFASAECTHLINALFFYKLFPEQLEGNSLHPEKLISLHRKLELLHHYLSLLRQQLYRAAIQHGLKPEVDFLFHSNELPPGIKFEIHPSYQGLIQEAVKQLKTPCKSTASKLSGIYPIHDLFTAYKFWFNPSRLIDTVMVLRQTLASEDKSVFYQEMVSLYHQLSTTECLDLYGYFSNKDTRYLFYTLSLILNASDLSEWLPPLKDREKETIQEGFHTLQIVMEALRTELKNRAIHTDSYQYELPKKVIEIRKRNRQAVLRLIEIYSAKAEHNNLNLEQLFMDMDES